MKSDPSRPLKDTKQERYAQERAQGVDRFHAYEAAGYRRNRGNASRFEGRHPEVVARIAHLMAKGAARAEITVARVLAELAKIGFANMQDYMRVGPDGDPYLDFSALTPEQAAALSEVTVEDFKDGRGEDARDVRRVKFKLHDKKGALVDIGKHLGMFVEKHEHSGPDGGPITYQSMTEAEIDRRLAELAAKEAGATHTDD